MTEREEFLENVRLLLGKTDGPAPVVPAAATGLSTSVYDALAAAEGARAVMAERADGLLDEAAAEAESGGWVVHRVAAVKDVAAVITQICRDHGAKNILMSSQDVLSRAGVSEALTAAGADVSVLQRHEGEESGGTTPAAFAADVGVTGADYLIAETGTLVLHPRAGLSRLVSLVPPLHIAVAEKGQVLPSLDELFQIERASHLTNGLSGSMNLISGPSRTGDIEGAIVIGVHGPTETHLVLVG